MPNADDDPLLTTVEMAVVLGVTPGTLEVWRSTKRYLADLPYIKIGRNVRYRRSAGLKFLERRTVSA
jgi:helix-turn-helix protein